MQVTVSAKYNLAWREAMKKVQTLGGVKGVKVGIIEPTTNDKGESIGFYAACNEFGTDSIPARPFMRMTAEKHMHEWARLFASVTDGKIIENPSIVKRAFAAIGGQAVAQMKEMIKSNIGPANAPAYAEWKKNKPATSKSRTTTTSEAGGYTGTLVYSGQMLQSITFRLYEHLSEAK